MSELLTHEQVCELLGVTRQTLFAWRKDPEKQFPTALWDMTTRSLVWRLAEVEAWIAAQRTEGE